MLDAVHCLGVRRVETRFFLDERRKSGGIRLTNELRAMAASAAANLEQESEARWRLVETAWGLGAAHSEEVDAYFGGLRKPTRAIKARLHKLGKTHVSHRRSADSD